MSYNPKRKRVGEGGGPSRAVATVRSQMHRGDALAIAQRYHASKKHQGRSRGAPYNTSFRLANRPVNATRGFIGAAGDAKYVDIASASYEMCTTGSTTHISIVPQGTTVNTRLGKSFRCTSLQIRGFSLLDSAASQVFNSGRIYIVWDSQPNKAKAAVTDILDAATSSSLVKRENASRFKILRKLSYDQMGLAGGASAAGVSGTELISVDEFIKFENDLICTLTTADTTGVIGDVVTGALLLVAVGSNATTLASNFTVTMRLNFVDV